jgi:hypothetical protein
MSSYQSSFSTADYFYKHNFGRRGIVETPDKGTIIIVEAPDFFKGKKLAAVLNKCKYHNNAIECFLFDPKASERKICVSLDKIGDSMTMLTDISSTIDKSDENG